MSGKPGMVAPMALNPGLVICAWYQRAGNDNFRCGSLAKITDVFFSFGDVRITQALLPIPSPENPRYSLAERIMDVCMVDKPSKFPCAIVDSSDVNSWLVPPYWYTVPGVFFGIIANADWIPNLSAISPNAKSVHILIFISIAINLMMIRQSSGVQDSGV